MKRVRTLPAVPDKHFFKIGEVATLLGVRTSVLRFWETEFERIRPTKSNNGHRVYGRSDVELLRRIHQLVHVKGMTLSGARALLQQGEVAVQAVLDAQPIEVASERDAASERARQADAEVAELRQQVAALERTLRQVRDESFFWQRRALQAEKAGEARLRQAALAVERLRRLVENLPSSISD